MKESTRREIVGTNQELYVCPECGKPFANVSTTESHANNMYEVHLKASH